MSTKKKLVDDFVGYILDNNGTPYIVVYTKDPRNVIPFAAADEPLITLNISSKATRNFGSNEEYMFFSCRNKGVSVDCTVHYDSIFQVHTPDDLGAGLGVPMARFIVQTPVSEQKAPETSRKPGLSLVK